MVFVSKDPEQVKQEKLDKLDGVIAEVRECRHPAPYYMCQQTRVSSWALASKRPATPSP